MFKILNFINRHKKAWFISVSGICFVSILISLIFFMKRNCINPFEKKEKDITNTTSIEMTIGPYTITNEEYNYMYYKEVYNYYPNLLGRSLTYIDDYLIKNSTEENDLKQKIKDSVEKDFKALLAYDQYFQNNNIEIDLNQTSIEMYKLNLFAKKYDIKYTDFLKLYGKNASDKSLSRLNGFYLKKEYINTYLRNKFIEDGSIDKYYKENKDYIDQYWVDLLVVGPETDENGEIKNEKFNKDTVLEDLKLIYSKTHNRNDFIKMAEEYLEKNKSEGDGIDVTLINSDDTPLDSLYVYFLDNSVFKWYSSAERKPNDVSLIEGDGCYYIVYFNKRECDQSNTFLVSEIVLAENISLNEIATEEIIDENTGETVKSEFDLILESFADKVLSKMQNELINSAKTFYLKYLDAIFDNYDNKIAIDAKVEKIYPISQIENQGIKEWLNKDNIGQYEIFLTDNSRLYIVYIDSEGLQKYQEDVLEDLIQEKHNEIISSYDAMLSNIKYE